MTQAKPVTIGELSRQTGCKIETIRYYERIGLTPPPPRSPGRYRLYDAADAQLLGFVRRARRLGFTLDEVRALLRIAADAHGTCRQALDIATPHLSEIRAKIADLAAMERVLAATVRQCEAGERPQCPLLEALSADEPSGPAA
jgi:MerR family mercuric resistance operon transcriptional regulator